MLPKIKLEHTWVGTNRYYVCPDGTAKPGVTTVLGATDSDAFIFKRWRAKVGEEEARRITQEAIARGAKLHAEIESYLMQQEIYRRSPILQGERFVILPKKPDDLDSCWGKSIQPVLETIDQVLLLEGSIFYHGYAGTIDCIAIVEGKTTILDWKTARKRKSPSQVKKHLDQIAAYAKAANVLYGESHGLKITHGIVAVALADRPAQVFKINTPELDKHWGNFEQRLIQFATAS
ncbi:MAG: PD-(D/E)XK nuclease family protein [Desertifilum sp.]|nr:PD-(D/E)XK nuclease family protein [Desertifilum sp.]